MNLNYPKKKHFISINFDLCFQTLSKGGVTYRDEPWHKECFVCTNCKTQLAGQHFTSRDDSPYCLKCFGNLYAKKCEACTKPITGKMTSLCFTDIRVPFLLSHVLLLPCNQTNSGGLYKVIGRYISSNPGNGGIFTEKSIKQLRLTWVDCFQHQSEPL